MVETESCSIQLNKIDWNDTSCLITYGPLPHKLLVSIQTVGLIEPPLLQGKKNGLFRIVCGGRRLAACKKIGLDSVSCRVLPSSFEHQRCLRLAIYDNVAQRTLNPVEKSLVLAKMANYLEEPQLIDEFMPLLDLEPSITLFNRYLGLHDLEEVILNSLAAGRLNERIAFALATQEQGDRFAYLHLLEELPFSVSVQEEIIETVEEIARKDNLTPEQILSSKEVRALQQASKRPARQRAQEIRKHLQARRNPRLTARRERFAREARDLGLPSGVRLVPPPYFEGPKWILECTFERAEELASRLRHVAQLADQPELQGMMESKSDISSREFGN
ncbi:MAG: ParB/RepB/Spo0J family partition protein [Syntrophobacteria bacterium]|jgi:ParB-like chromosome segregation protein Spo0J